MNRLPLVQLTLLICVCLLLSSRASAYTLFESDPVRPLAVSSDGRYLAVANAPGGTVELYRLGAGRPTRIGVIPVGLEPVALAWRGSWQLWVVNHLSDSVSVVEVDGRGGSPGRVIRTLLVGDEPRDIVFAGDRAFVTTAHRGQNAPDAESTTPGVGRADVWVFDPDAQHDTFGGSPDAIVTLFTDAPRALAVSADQSTVYAAGYRTGNRTTALHYQAAVAAGLPPLVDGAGVPQVPTGLIVQSDGAAWRGPGGVDLSAAVRFDLPDLDVFALDATALSPTVTRAWSGVGTVLFGMAVDPVTGEVFVTNTEANNATRFEGDGSHGTTVRGELHRAQVSILGAEPAPRVRHLNKHIDYATCCEARPNATNAASLATPMAPAISADGATIYVPGFGSSAIGVYGTAALRDDSFVPDAADQIAVSGGGPASIVLDEARGRAYVLTRFDNAVSVIDLATRLEVHKVWLRNPEPTAIREGRRFLYDARYTSGNGEASCASCHVFGDLDHLAWDLGDPGATTAPDANPRLPLPFPIPAAFPFSDDFQALKGPMTTQSLRGMDNHGPMHWRGDRTGAGDAANVQPDSGAYDERAAFAAFNGAFESLIGRDVRLTESEMASFAEFALALTYPPNPIRRLDNDDTALEARGRALYFGRATDVFGNCNGCHTLDPDGNAALGVERPGFFGTDGRSSFDGIPQAMKIPHLRNAYQKVGMFGLPALPAIVFPSPTDGLHLGDQIRGFGFSHDGSVDTLMRFFSAAAFAVRAPGTVSEEDPGVPTGLGFDAEGGLDRRALEAFVLAFPSNLAPIVGQQITVAADNRGPADDRVALLIERAEADECDLVVQARTQEGHWFALYAGDGSLALDDGSLITLADAMQTLPATWTCVPPGEGERYAYDRL